MIIFLRSVELVLHSVGRLSRARLLINVAGKKDTGTGQGLPPAAHSRRPGYLALSPHITAWSDCYYKRNCFPYIIAGTLKADPIRAILSLKPDVRLLCAYINGVYAAAVIILIQCHSHSVYGRPWAASGRNERNGETITFSFMWV